MPDSISQRPAIPVPVQREVLHESCHRCAVCGFGLSIELAHIIPWRKTQDHCAANLIALCATCHEMADLQKWNSKDFEVYKQKPWALRVNVAKPASAPQQAMVDLILARDAADMGEFQRIQLVQMIAAYSGVMVSELKVVAVTPSNSSLIRLEMPKAAAENLIASFQSEDPRLASFLGEFAHAGMTLDFKEAGAEPDAPLFGAQGGIKLIETARPTPAERPPVTNVKEEGLESLIVNAMTAFGWLAGSNADYEREYAVDLTQLTAFLEATQEHVAQELALRTDGPLRRKFLAQLQGEITRRGTIDVMRKGVGHGKHYVALFYGKPSAENEKAVARHAANRFSITRQLRYSREETKRALDLVLFINGLPVATFELKNSLTKQMAEDAVEQYKRDRDPRETLFAPHTREFEPSLLPKCKSEFRRNLVAFDWWVRNADRTLGDYSGNPNLLWDTEAVVPVVIDHNMAFDRDFEPVKFLETHIFQVDLAVLKTDWVMRAEYEQRFSSLVPLLADIWAELPQNWLETEDGDNRFLQLEFRLVLDRVNQPQFWDTP